MIVTNIIVLSEGRPVSKPYPANHPALHISSRRAPDGPYVGVLLMAALVPVLPVMPPPWIGTIIIVIIVVPLLRRISVNFNTTTG